MTHSRIEWTTLRGGGGSGTCEIGYGAEAVEGEARQRDYPCAKCGRRDTYLEHLQQPAADLCPECMLRGRILAAAEAVR